MILVVVVVAAVVAANVVVDASERGLCKTIKDLLCISTDNNVAGLELVVFVQKRTVLSSRRLRRRVTTPYLVCCDVPFFGYTRSYTILS